MDLEKIGMFIAKERKEKGLTQAELAEKLNVSDKAVSKWERGLCLMDMSLLSPLSEILDVSVNELLAGERIAKDNIELLNSTTVSGIKSYQKKFKKKIITVLGCLYLSIVIPCLIYTAVQLFNIPLPGPQSIKDIKAAHAFYDALYYHNLDMLEKLVTNPYHANSLLIKNPYIHLDAFTPEEFINNIREFYNEGGNFISFKGQRNKGIFNSLEMYYELCASLNGEEACIYLFVEDFHGHAYFTTSAMWDPKTEPLTKRLITMFEPYDIE